MYVWADSKHKAEEHATDFDYDYFVDDTLYNATVVKNGHKIEGGWEDNYPVGSYGREGVDKKVGEIVADLKDKRQLEFEFVKDINQ